ncbi:uncharacterized protein KGF55_001405 [Candida pseudojiufengensis]|uniref:uncharacterized protein n=1 Tax=Candida pseudojiufengensis TaxID=497109 RepID=UPI0022246ECC|nr:uncharacterized protein KGF55_001405 [Candida pseudojiufengensis]KAI5965185.1 hypothetical protein KGF55_001405 [Candida pseudojiufengensis]
MTSTDSTSLAKFLKKEKDQKVISFAEHNLKGVPIGNDSWQRMVSGMLYNPGDETLKLARLKVRDYQLDYEKFRFRDYTVPKEYSAAKREYLRKFIGHVGDGTFMEHPIYFDYGFNTYLGENFYSNYNLTILDCSIVKIGDNVICGTNVSILTPLHPIEPYLRLTEDEDILESAKPITIGNNCWLCSGCSITANIGNNCVIGANSVVSKDVPDNSLFLGNKVVRTLKETDTKENIERLLREYGYYDSK